MPRTWSRGCARVAQLVDDTIANLAIGLAAGRVSSAEKVRRVVEQLDGELAKPVDGWAMGIADVGEGASTDEWPAGDAIAARAAARGRGEDIAPAIARLRDFLRDRVLPEGARREGGPRGAARRRCVLPRIDPAITSGSR